MEQQVLRITMEPPAIDGGKPRITFERAGFQTYEQVIYLCTACINDCLRQKAQDEVQARETVAALKQQGRMSGLFR